MQKQNVRARLRRWRPATGAAPPPPSPAARARLEDALRGRADVYRADATVDLTLVDALVRMDEVEAAARTLDDHRASLRAMARDLQVVVADAAVEREAERIYDSCVGQLRSAVQLRTGLRRRAVALTGAAAVMLALLLPSNRISPRLSLVSTETRATHDEVVAAIQRLEAARSAVASLRAESANLQPSVPEVGADAVVRSKVRAVLAGDARRTTRVASVTRLTDARPSREAKRAGRQANRREGDQLAPVVPLPLDKVPPQTGQQDAEMGLTPPAPELPPLP